MDSNLCQAIKTDGTRCRAKSLHGSDFCFFHDPDRAGERAAAQQAGGRKGRSAVLPPETTHREVGTAADVIGLLGETINQVRTGALDPRVGNCVGYLSGTILKAIEHGELEERLATLEGIVAHQTAPTDLFQAKPEELVIDGEERTDEGRACA